MELTIADIRRINIELLIKESGLGKGKFAEKIETAPAYISQILSEKTNRDMGSDLARKIERLLKKPHGWMDAVHDSDDPLIIKEENKLSLSSQLDNMKLRVKKIPLIDFNRAGSWQEVLRNHTPSDGDIMIIDDDMGDHVFAVPVQGDSMRPEFDKDDILLIDPDLTPKHQDFVLAGQEGEVVLRHYWREGGRWYLKPLNERYAIEPAADLPIIGVVTDKVIRKKYR